MPTAKPTPIRRQYLHIKRRHPDAIVFFRLGDFYETFDEDAHILSKELDVVLTSRNVAKGQRIPMAGVPHHAADSYIAKLVAKGYKVAICEQVARQPIDGLMPREVVRVVTPGTVVDPALLTEKRNNYLASLVVEDGEAGVAYVDITTGEFATTQLRGEQIWTDTVREVERLAPAELIISDGGDGFLAHGQEQTEEARRRHPPLTDVDASLVLYDDWRFELGICQTSLLEHLCVSTLAGFGCADLPLATRAAGSIVQYLREHQPSSLAQLSGLQTYAVSTYMSLDVATRRNLELVETIRDRSFRGSLLWVLDSTLTPMGGRLLRRWLGQPLLDAAAVERRLKVVDACYQDLPSRAALREMLRGFGDLERLTNRVVQGIAGPRDLVALSRSLQRAQALGERLEELRAACVVEGATKVYPLTGEGMHPP